MSIRRDPPAAVDPESLEDLVGHLERVAGSEQFEQLLIGAGRLSEMAVGGAEGWLPVEDFVDAMRSLGLDDEQLGNWRFFAEAALVGG